jgi:hypothetical protein
LRVKRRVETTRPKTIKNRDVIYLLTELTHHFCQVYEYNNYSYMPI